MRLSEKKGEKIIKSEVIWLYKNTTLMNSGDCEGEKGKCDAMLYICNKSRNAEQRSFKMRRTFNETKRAVTLQSPLATDRS
jgi:hypothetical protein